MSVVVTVATGWCSFFSTAALPSCFRLFRFVGGTYAQFSFYQTSFYFAMLLYALGVKTIMAETNFVFRIL